MIAFVWADNDGAEPVMELCAAPASGIYVLKLSVGGEGGQKYTLTYMFVMLDACGTCVGVAPNQRQRAPRGYSILGSERG